MTAFDLYRLRAKARYQTTAWMRAHRVRSWVIWTEAQRREFGL